MRGLVVGGLGGGGDVGLASVIVEGLGLRDRVVAVLSFRLCRARSVYGSRVGAHGTLVRVPPGKKGGERFFEDKLGLAASWAEEVYVACVKEAWAEVVEDVKNLVRRFGGCMIHTDIGGDALLLGYEGRLGSFRADALARSILAEVSKALGVPSIVGVGLIGGEGGGGELDPAELAATLAYLSMHGAVIGKWSPPPDSTRVAELLDRLGSSGMLPLYLASVKGPKEVTLRRAYLAGTYTIMPWYRYVVFIDTMRHCELSPLCKNARKGLRHWDPPHPPKDYKKLVREAASLGGKRALARVIEGIPDIGSKELISHCFGS